MIDIHQIVNRQINRWNLERQSASRRDDETSESAEKVANLRPVIALSRQRGCRGQELARVLARSLGYGVFDRQVIEYISRDRGVKSSVIQSLDEHLRSNMDVWVEGLMSDKVFDHDDYIRSLSEVIKSTSLQGGVVILGRGANFLLSETQAYRIRIVAPETARIHNLMATNGMSESQARDEIRKVDAERAKFVRRYFRRDIDDPAAYDLTVNLGTHKLEQVTKVILAGLRARGWPMQLTGGDKRLRAAG